MKLRLKLAVAAFPVPAAYWVFKSKEPWWTKTIVGVWTLFIALLLLGIMVNDENGFKDDLTGYLTIAFIVSFFTACVHAITWAVAKDKETKQAIDAFTIQPQPITTNHAPLSDAQIAILYKLALQILEDDKVDLDEVKSLRGWFKRHPESAKDYRTQELFELTSDVLEDQVLDKEEALDVFVVLSEFCDEYEESQQVSINQAPNKPQVHGCPSEISVNHLTLEREYYMEYLDSRGTVTKRNIILHDIEKKSGTVYLYGYCLLRGGSRTFKADNVQMLCDVKTGEVLIN
ncbi:hypothetical protein [Vibrio neptunius]|uniref:hypothetical protein n=1 Tax=Vibrio neptunius TaxID=170651 RepID=UPI0019CFD620|nr:hypothetical protein [Vibrio neptunius]MBN3573991.1 hypothetical protein [Vibrio neptunius]